MAAQKCIYKSEFDKKISLGFYRYYMLRNSFFMYFFTVFGLVALFMLVSGGFKNEENTSTYFLMWTIAILGIVFVPTALHLVATFAPQVVFLNLY